MAPNDFYDHFYRLHEEARIEPRDVHCCKCNTQFYSLGNGCVRRKTGPTAAPTQIEPYFRHSSSQFAVNGLNCLYSCSFDFYVFCLRK